jgi:hypothetical protein
LFPCKMPNTHEWNRKPPESRVHVKLLFVLGYRQGEVQWISIILEHVNHE